MTVLLFAISNQIVWGHALVIDQSPKPYSQQKSSPSEVVIRFNSPVEKNFSIKVINENNQEVEVHSPNISQDQKQISIQLPMLENGIYGIEYYVISSNDGHSVQDSYQFQVLNSEEIFSEQEDEGNNTNLKSQTNLSSTSPQLSSSNLLEFLIYFLKSLYYVGIVILIGWIIWWRIVQSYTIEIKRKYLLLGIVFQMIHLVGLISVILIQVDIFTSHGIFFTPSFPFDTSFGSFWLISLVLSLLGFLVLFKNRWIDLIWILILVLCKSLNGHASGTDLTYVVAVLNSIHMIGAAIWAAGITFIVLFWRKYRLYVKTYLPVFSKYAFISFIVLTITGFIIIYMYSPSYELIMYEWGRVLLLKLIFVLFVVLIAVLIRHKMKDQKLGTVGNWLKIDFLFMLVILITVSILTYLNPLP
nr:copper resistance protein CopC [Lysinibacillus timonensis]